MARVVPKNPGLRCAQDPAWGPGHVRSTRILRSPCPLLHRHHERRHQRHRPVAEHLEHLELLKAAWRDCTVAENLVRAVQAYLASLLLERDAALEADE